MPYGYDKEREKLAGADMKTALRLTLAMACTMIMPCAAAHNIFPDSTDPRWAPLEETFLVPYEGELPKLNAPKTARLWQPFLRKGKGHKLCNEVREHYMRAYLNPPKTREDHAANRAAYLPHYTQVSLSSLYNLEKRDPKLDPWTGPEVETENIYHDWGDGPKRFGQLIRFKDRPHDIFLQHRRQGSWRGDSGGYYRFDAAQTSWGLLQSELSDVTKISEYSPENLDKDNVSDRAIFAQGFKAYTKAKAITLNEEFVVPAMHLMWKDTNELYFLLARGDMSILSRHHIYNGAVDYAQGGHQTLCDVALVDKRQDIRYDRIGYTGNASDLEPPQTLSSLETPLRRYFERVAQMVGNGQGYGGSSRSYSRNISQGQGLRQGFLTRPWAYTNPPITGGYSEDTAEKLRRWSYQDAWSRHVYLDALSRYDAARSDAADYLSSAYSGPVPHAEDYAQNAMTAITRRHFWFDVNALERVGIFAQTNPHIPSIYEGTISIANYATVLEKARANAALAALNGTPRRNSYRVIATLHDYLTAALWHDDLFGVYIEGGYDVNASNHFGKTPLMVAAHLDFEPRVSALIEAGADIHIAIPNKTASQMNRFPKRPRSALDYALENGSWDTIYALMDAGGRRAQGSEKMMSTKDLLLLNPNLSDYGRAYIAGELAFRSP